MISRTVILTFLNLPKYGHLLRSVSMQHTEAVIFNNKMLMQEFPYKIKFTEIWSCEVEYLLADFYEISKWFKVSMTFIIQS